jgi:hypothetical protein
MGNWMVYGITEEEVRIVSEGNEGMSELKQ